MAKIILEGTSSEYLGGTAFGFLLFPQSKPSDPRYADELGLAISGFQRSEPILDIARIFLDNGQDPNMEMIAQSEFATMPCGSPKGPRPLHVAFNGMARLLLSYSAELNARDRAGRTPLDVALQKVVFGWRPNTTELSYEYRDYQLLIMDHIDMLIGEGGCITREGFRFYPSCIAMFRGARRNLEALLDLPRRSVKNGFLSKLDLHVVPIVSRVEVPIRRLVARRRHRDDDYV